MRIPCRGLLAFVVLFLGSVPLVAAQSLKNTAVADPKGPCSIAGTVVGLARSEPLKNAVLQLLSADDDRGQASVKTDAGGRFEFKGLEPGRYRLRVTRPGFVS